MAQNVAEVTSSNSFRRLRCARPSGAAVVIAVVLLAGATVKAQEETRAIDDITAKYHFLSADDTLAILDEEGKLKGYIEVAQPENESDDTLNYDIVEGSRDKMHVKFRTNRIHGKYYRFTGTVERGKGHEQRDPEYFRLIGDLDTVTVKADTDDVAPDKVDAPKETVQTTRVVLRSFGKSERPDE